MANFLAIEAASDSCSLALSLNGDIHQVIEHTPRMHSRLLYPMLNQLMADAQLKPAQLDAIVFGKGPGSFTGLRIAAATAQGIGFACEIPLIGVSTLQAMAEQGRAQHNFEECLCLLDARMQEIYLGHYRFDADSQLMTAVQADQIAPVDANLDALNLKITRDAIAACGQGLQLQDQLHHSLLDKLAQQDAQQVLEAQYLFKQGEYLFFQQQVLKPEEVELVYLREQNHWKTIKEQKALK